MPSSEDAGSIVVAGATGLVGSALVAHLVERKENGVVALVRSAKPGRFDASVEERVFDYDADASYEALSALRPSVVFCCLGTTRAKAGSDEAFRKVDGDYPKRLVEAAKRASATTMFGLVSSVGASSPRGLYLSTKFDVEKALALSGLPHVIVRPSFLLGDRAEKRFGERVGIVALGPILSGLGAVSKSMKRYAPIQAADVARALAHLALDVKATEVVEGDDLFRAARGAA